MALTLRDSMARYEIAKSDRGTFDQHWQEMADLVLPTRDFTVTNRQQGEQRRIPIFDGTAPLANDTLASALHFLLTNPADRWVDIQLEEYEGEPDQEGAAWLYDTTNRILTYLSWPISGFPTAAHEVYQDLGAFGNGPCQAGPPKLGLLRFTSRSLGGMHWLDDDEGNITDVFRTTEVRIRDLAVMFDSLPSSLQGMLRTASGAEEKRCLVHHVWERRDRDPMGQTNLDMPWSRYFLDGGADRDAELDVGGFLENPYLTPRWSKASEETYGRGPGMSVLPTIKAVNAMSRDQLLASALALRPPMAVWDTQLKYRKLDLNPGGIIWMSQSAREPPKAVVTGTDPNAGQLTIERAQAMIEKAYYLDTIELPLVRKSHSAMTAEEIIARRQQALAKASPIISRLQAEWLQPVISRTFSWLMRSGNLLPVPESLSGRRLRPVFTSPLAQSQRSSEIRNINEALQESSLAIQTDPSAVLNLDANKAFRRIWSLRNADPRLLRPIRLVQQMQQQQAQQAELAQQATTARELAAAGKDASVALQGLPAPAA